MVVVLDSGEGSSKLRGRDEGHDVRVVLEDKHSLVRSLIKGGGSDSNNGSLSQVWELELKSKGVESLTRVVSKLKLVGVVIKLENLEDLGDDVEVSGLLRGLLEVNNSVSTDVIGLEELVSPLSEGTNDGGVLLLNGGSLSGESVWLVSSNVLSEWVGLIGGEKSVGGLIEHVDIELSLVLPDSHVSSVDSDDISESVDDWEVLELVGIDDNGGIGTLLEESWVNNLKRADESVLVDLVWESSVNNDTIEVLWLRGGEGSLSELNVLVL